MGVDGSSGGSSSWVSIGGGSVGGCRCRRGSRLLILKWDGTKPGTKSASESSLR